MTRVALTKLFILVILAFIICLPEFFVLYRGSKVNFFCLPYRPCERGNQAKRGGNWKNGDAEIRRKDVCDPSQTPGSLKWEQECTQEHQSNATDPESGGKDPEKSWFMCETDVNMAELQRNTSSSALKTYIEVSVEIQLRDAETLNLTLYGRSNHSSLRPHPPEEEDEDDEGQRKAFYCCLPVPPTSESANQSRCLLWLANQAVLTATAKEKLPWKRTQKDEWRCVVRVLWLVLVCVVVLTTVAAVLGQIYCRTHSCKKPRELPVGYDNAGQQLTGMILHSYSPQPRPGLSPIHEVDTQETLLDGNGGHCYTANLHDGIHPSTCSVTEQQAS